MKVKYRTKKVHQTNECKSEIDNSVPSEKHKTKHTKSTFELLCNLIASLATALSCFLACLTLYFALYPQHKPSNTNYLEMANAGDIKSQVKLADLSYKIGQIDNAIYWYSIAALENSEYQGIALNNLASIYLNHESYSALKTNVYHECMDMFSIAMASGKFEAAQNLYMLLISNPHEYFDDRHDIELENAEEFLFDHEYDLQELSQYEIQWTLVENIALEEALSKYGRNPEYTFMNRGPVYLNDGDSSKTIIYVSVHKRSDDSPHPVYKYIDVNIS